MPIDSVTPNPLLVAVPLEWQNEIATILENERYAILFAESKNDIVKIIQSRQLQAVIVTSDLVFDDNVSQDLIALTFGKIPTLTIILQETFEKFGQSKVFGKVYNPEAFQEFCTAPFSMEELIPRLRKAIRKAENISLQ